MIDEPATKRLKVVVEVKEATVDKQEKQSTNETDSQPMKAVLYSYWRSSCSWRVRIALAYKQIPYTYEAVHLVAGGGQQYQTEYASKNPNSRVPLLYIDGQNISQSAAICEYLEETRPEMSLLPSDSLERARVREIMGLIGCDIQPIQNLAVLKHVTGLMPPETNKSDASMAWGRHWITRGFQAVEAQLVHTSKRYCVGDALSLADVFLVPQVYNAQRFQVNMTAFPNITRVHKTLMEHPAFQSTQPSQMPDAIAE